MDASVQELRAGRPTITSYINDRGSITFIVPGTGIKWADGTTSTSASSGGALGITQLTSDVTAGPGTGTQAATVVHTQPSAVDLSTVTAVFATVGTSTASLQTQINNNATLLDYKAPVRLATTGALATNNYANGSSGVGATITGVSIGTLSLDDAPALVGDRVLIKDEGTASHNGIYTVTQNSALVVFILTRATDHDQAVEMSSGTMVTVTSGTVNGGTGVAGTGGSDPGTFVQITKVNTVGTDNVSFIETSGLGEVIAGSGLSKSGLTLAVDSSSVPVKSAGLIRNSEVDKSSITAQGNVFNGAGQLVKLDAGPKYPAIDGSQITNLPSASGGAVLASTQTFTGANTFISSVTVGPTVYGSTANYASILKNGWSIVASTQPGGTNKTCFYGINGNYDHLILWNFTQNTSNGVAGFQWNNDATANKHKWHTTYDVTTANHFYSNAATEWNVFNGNALSSGGQWRGHWDCQWKPGDLTQVHCDGTGTQDGDSGGDGFGHLTMSGMYGNTTASTFCAYTSAGSYTGTMTLWAAVRGTQ